MDDSDMLLVAQGCSVAFERIVRRHESRLVNWIRKVCNPNDADDLSQEVFIRIFTKSSRYQPGNFVAWMFRIARNVVTDNARANGRRCESTVSPDCGDDTDGDWLSRNAIETSDPAIVAENRDEIRVVQEALAGVLPDQSDVLYCFAEGWSLPEISEMAGVCLATTKGRLRLCRDHIQQAVNGSPKRRRRMAVASR